VLLQAAPDCSEGYRLKAQSYLEAVWFGLTPEPQSALEKGAELARHTLRMAGTNPNDHAILGVIYLLQQQYEQALSAGRKALEMGPHDAHTYFLVGIIFRYVRQYDDALFAFNRAVRLDPVTPLYYLNALAWTYLLSEQPDKALEVFNRSLARNPDNLFAELGQVAANCLAGREQLAQYQAARLRRRHPHFRLVEWANSEPYQYREEIRDLVAALGQSGLP
jgi:tetratricopeptide (TPR) repeat protein